MRELWHRASLALNQILSQQPPAAQTASPGAARSASNTAKDSTSLVVAHNAVNQALLCVTLGLQPARFRTLVQSNAATSRLRFLPDGDRAARPVLLHLNQCPEILNDIASSAKPASTTRIVIVTAGEMSEKALIAIAAVVSTLQVDQLVSDDDSAARKIADCIADRRNASDESTRRPKLWQPLRENDAKLLTCPLLQINLLAEVMALQRQDTSSPGLTLAVITSPERSKAIIQTLLNVPHSSHWLLQLRPGGISVVDIKSLNEQACVQADTVHCMNNRAHLKSG